ncbi:MAG: hypothetical protein CL748_01710 [Chloroflexi bacterium]|nr:hypothetical protein [Chloroflexota bacterium]
MKNFRKICIPLVIIFFIPSFMFIRGDRNNFDIQLFNQISNSSPDFVFIGNSMLETRINDKHLEKISNKDVILLTLPGGMSSAWYLYFKNFVVQTNIKPKNVFIFFRDYELSKPLYRTTGEYSQKLDLLSYDEEQEFDFIIDSNSGIGEKLSRIFDDIYPVQSKKNKARDLINRMAVTPFIPKIIPYTILRISVGLNDEKYLPILRKYKDVQNSTNDLFDRKNFRSTEISEISNISTKFEENDSFLSALVNMSKNNDIELTFVRVQKRPNIDNSFNFDPNLQEYINQLSSYLRNKEINFIDLSERSFGVEYYLDGDHINPEYIEEYTDFFYKEHINYFGGVD